jgi:DNA processing protein
MIREMRVDGEANNHLSDQERLDRLRLIRSDNVGPRTFRALVNHFGSAGAALDALPALARRGGASQPIRVCPRADAERELVAAARIGVSYVADSEPEYPVRLHEIDDAPPLLGVRGNLPVLVRPMVGIVGSRNASAAGIKFAQMIARDLGEAGFAIVSGLARGIDAAAHRATVASGTVAVLAGGNDHIYPPEHGALAQALLANGAAVSEMPLGWEPRARDFPRRNRLISGMAAGVIIVEAAKRSGSLITARFALEQGREVFAVPGSPLDPRAEGTNGLLKQGATPVTEAADVVSALAPILGRLPEPPATGPGPPGLLDHADGDKVTNNVLSLLGPTPVAIDELIRLSGATPATVRMVLLELEIAGRVRYERGGLVALA